MSESGRIVKLWDGKKKCVHGSYEYDEETRQIFCAKCNELVDPVSALKRMSHYLTTLQMKISRHKVEMEKIEKRKRVKCQHCNRFTNLSLNLTWSDQFKFKETVD